MTECRMRGFPSRIRCDQEASYEMTFECKTCGRSKEQPVCPKHAIEARRGRLVGCKPCGNPRTGAVVTRLATLANAS